VTLSGKLGFVPIDEVLRLLTRSNQQGAVEVTGVGLRGHVFVGKGGIDLATTTSEDVLQRHLANSGYASSDTLRRINSGETTLAAIAEGNQEIVELIREMTVESLYQISLRGDEFSVREGAVTPYASPKSFELEALLTDAQERGKDWAKVNEVVPHLEGAIHFRRDLGERQEVTVRSDDWRVLSEIGTGSSVSAIADMLGTTEFWAARVTARLVKSELIDLEGPATPEQPEDQDAVWEEPVSYDDLVEEPQTSYDETPSYDTAYVADQPQVAVTEEEVSADQESEDSERWWQEPTGDSDGAVEAEYSSEVVSEVVSEEVSETPATARDEEVEEDTEAFLEKVFSELDSTEPEAEEGHGLLRRRRMGTLRDFSSDS
jgi:hypothetical protein